MTGKLSFYYLGDDEAFFRALQTGFKTNTKLDIGFVRLHGHTESEIQSLFTRIHKAKPHCILIDFSNSTEDYLHLARLITRTKFENKPITIGLLDLLSTPQTAMESHLIGMNLTHVKSSDNFDLVFDVAKLLSPKDGATHTFATAKLKDDWTAGVPCKIGYVDRKGLHFETDYPLNAGERIRFTHQWAPKIVPSFEMFVKAVSDKNLYYQFAKSVDAEFVFIDEFQPPEGMEADVIREKKALRDEQLLDHKKKLEDWIEKNLTKSHEKKAKVLVIDREFLLYQNQKRSDKLPYTIRCIPDFDEIESQLNRLKPQVIAVSLENPETANAKNTTDRVVDLIRLLKRDHTDTVPFVVIFNTKAASKRLQESLGYPHTMATDAPLSVDVLVKMAEMFEKKLGAGPGEASRKVFIKKTNPLSVGEIQVPIKVMKLSETDMVFQSTYPLEAGVNLHVSEPVKMHIHVQPLKSQSKIPEFMGLIHGLDEQKKKDLRKYINLVFFRDHDAQVGAEANEFKKLNEAKLLEKAEKEKATAEEQEKTQDDGAGEVKKSEKTAS